jgi:hypothetical protein
VDIRILLLSMTWKEPNETEEEIRWIFEDKGSYDNAAKASEYYVKAF